MINFVNYLSENGPCRKPGIYCFNHVGTDRYYVGSAVNLYGRVNLHLHQLRKSKHHNRFLQRAWDKYGEEKFSIYVIEFCDRDNLVEREQFYMDHYKAVDAGFNMARIAGNTSGTKRSESVKIKMREAWKRRAPMTEETRRKYSAVKRGVKLSESHRKKLSELCKERAKLPVSDETRKKMSESAKKRNKNVVRDSLGRIVRFNEQPGRKQGYKDPLAFGSELGVKWSDDEQA